MAHCSETEINYVGSELDVFSQVKNWKAYWARMIGPYIGNEVLDVGAGIGSTAINLRKRSYINWVELEPDPKLAARILEKQQSGEVCASIQIRNGIITDLKDHELFDTVLYIDVLEHIKDDRTELSNVAKHVKPNGHVIVLSPAHQILFTEFDRQVGHCRRYNKRQLIDIKPKDLEIVKIRYLDSVGMLASLGNKLLLRSGTPAIKHVKIWDTFMVPFSNIIDPLTGYNLGKSIIGIYKKI